MNKISLQLVTPERTVLSEKVASLSCPTSEGQITILPGHTAFVATLINGELIAKTDTEQHAIHVASGFIQVKEGDTVIILADGAEHHYEIDMAEAEQAKQKAEQTLREQNLSDEEYAFAAAALEKSSMRMRIARKHAHRRKTFSDETTN